MDNENENKLMSTFTVQGPQKEDNLFLFFKQHVS